MLLWLTFEREWSTWSREGLVEEPQWCVFRYSVTLLDAPGHQDFVPNLITGVAQADAALLIVDGAPGGFEAGFGTKQASGGSHAPLIGQTREHVHVARSAGIKQLAVVITKLDVCEYKQDRFEEIKAQLAPFLKSCGFSQPEWLPVAAPDGQNVSTVPSDPRLLSWWRDNKTLVDAIDSFQPVTQHLSTLPALRGSSTRPSHLLCFQKLPGALSRRYCLCIVK